VLLIVVLGFAVHLLLPQVGELQQGLQAMRTGRWPFLGLALLGSALTYLGSTWAVRVSVDDPPRWGRTAIVQVAASAAAVLTPMGVGWVVVNEGFLRKEGIDEGTARAATGLNMILTVVSHVGLLVMALPFLPTIQLPTITPPERRVFVDIVVGVAVVVGIVFWIPHTRRRVLGVLRPTLQAVPRVVANPRRSLLMVAGAAAANLAYAVALYGAVAAFGPAPPPLGVLLAYLLAAIVGAVAPTPGGLGATETALVSALTRLAVPGGQAVAATLAFRLTTFWLPLAIGGLMLRAARARDWI
jgi:uncharacterized membrane protein YbhN (UPF0104 family)